MMDLVMLFLLLFPNAVILLLGVLMLVRKTAPSERGSCCRRHGSNPPAPGNRPMPPPGPPVRNPGWPVPPPPRRPPGRD